MTKKQWAYVLIAFGLALIWGRSQLVAGKIDTSTTMGTLTNYLASWSVLGNETAAATTTPYLAYGAIAAGAWMLFGRKVAAAV